MKTKYLIAAGGAALAATGAVMGLHLPFVVEAVTALALAGGVGTGLTLALGNGVGKNLLTDASDNPSLLPAPSSKLTKSEQEAINRGVEKLASIREASQGIRSPNTARQVRKICDVGDKIIQDFRDDPADISHARTWLDVYLDQTLEMVRKYAHLSRTGSRNIEAQRVLVEVEKTLVVIERQSAALLEKLLHNDIMGLDVNQQVIREILESEKM